MPAISKRSSQFCGRARCYALGFIAFYTYLRLLVKQGQARPARPLQVFSWSRVQAARRICRISSPATIPASKIRRRDGSCARCSMPCCAASAVLLAQRKQKLRAVDLVVFPHERETHGRAAAAEMFHRSGRESCGHGGGHPRSGQARRAQIVCLEELFRSQYFCREENADNFDLAEPIPGPTTEALSKLARQLDVVIIASIFERRAAGLYHNTAVVLDADGALLGLYRKMHIPDDPLYYEKYYFTPGDLGFPNFDTRYGSDRGSGLLGPVVSRRRATFEPARREYSFLSHGYRLASIGESWNSARRSSMHGARFSAPTPIANGVFVAAVNRVGFEGPADSGLNSGSLSFVADPFGQPGPAESPTNKEEILIAECDLGRMEEVRRNWPFLRDRRTDAYAPLLGAVAGLTSLRVDLSSSRPTARRKRAPDADAQYRCHYRCARLPQCPPNGSQTSYLACLASTNAPTGPANSRQYRGAMSISCAISRARSACAFWCRIALKSAPRAASCKRAARSGRRGFFRRADESRLDLRFQGRFSLGNAP